MLRGLLQSTHLQDCEHLAGILLQAQRFDLQPVVQLQQLGTPLAVPQLAVEKVGPDLFFLLDGPSTYETTTYFKLKVLSYRQTGKHIGTSIFSFL